MVKRDPYAQHLAGAPQRQLVCYPKNRVNPKLTKIRNQNVAITGHRIMVVSIGIIWTQRVKGHVHVQDMVPLSRTV